MVVMMGSCRAGQRRRQEMARGKMATMMMGMVATLAQKVTMQVTAKRQGEVGGGGREGCRGVHGW
jgi:hypothetical protein